MRPDRDTTRRSSGERAISSACGFCRSAASGPSFHLSVRPDPLRSGPADAILHHLEAHRDTFIQVVVLVIENVRFVKEHIASFRVADITDSLSTCKALDSTVHRSAFLCGNSRDCAPHAFGPLAPTGRTCRVGRSFGHGASDLKCLVTILAREFVDWHDAPPVQLDWAEAIGLIVDLRSTIEDWKIVTNGREQTVSGNRVWASKEERPVQGWEPQIRAFTCVCHRPPGESQDSFQSIERRLSLAHPRTRSDDRRCALRARWLSHTNLHVSSGGLHLYEYASCALLSSAIATSLSDELPSFYTRTDELARCSQLVLRRQTSRGRRAEKCEAHGA